MNLAIILHITLDLIVKFSEQPAPFDDFIHENLISIEHYGKMSRGCSKALYYHIKPSLF